MEAQKAHYSQSILSKRAMLEVSQYLTSNYTTEPWQQNSIAPEQKYFGEKTASSTMEKIGYPHIED
jgi:hypothetical protein